VFKKLNVIKKFIKCDHRIFLETILLLFFFLLFFFYLEKSLSFGENDKRNVKENFSYFEKKEIIESTLLIANIQDVIKKQIMFFKEGNCNKAYSYASLSIKFFFPKSDDFCLMVEKSYPMIWNPKKFIFFRPLIINGIIVQEIKFVDKYEEIHFYQYQMRKYGSDWKINGVFKY